MLHRREWLHRGIAGGASLVAASSVRSQNLPAERARPRVIDAHCHAGKGLNFGKGDPRSAPWTTFNDPERVLRQAAAAGIGQTVIFPINNTTFEKANEEIAGYVRRYPAKFIDFAKHDPKTEAGK